MIDSIDFAMSFLYFLLPVSLPTMMPPSNNASTVMAIWSGSMFFLNSFASIPFLIKPEIEFFQHVRIGGKKIAKGRYTLYAIVNENSWIILLNKDTDI